ncbi:MAG: glycosyltransferase [Geobacteraceae bacterium]|nr:glycosyltransferase [Geobacteraceae bacterium]
MNNSKRLWIAWEKQRRSTELARILCCKLYSFEYSGYLRYPKSIINTFKVLINKSTDIVFVQNPSMLLAAITCVFKAVFKIKVIVDRHTTFRLDKEVKNSLDYIVFKALHNYTIKNADLTIVTNDHLARIVEQTNGKAYVLPDKLPELSKNKNVTLERGFNVLLISSFGEDEPIEEALKAAELIENNKVYLYITGDCNKLKDTVRQRKSSNVIFTGYLKENIFIDYLFAVDAVMVLTTASCCMLCGCYEAVAARKPLITSEKNVLQDYFTGSVFVDNTSEGIVRGIEEMMENYDNYSNNAFKLKTNIDKTWANNFAKLEELIMTL